VEEKSISVFTISSYDAPFWKECVKQTERMTVWYCVCACVYTFFFVSICL